MIKNYLVMTIGLALAACGGAELESNSLATTNDELIYGADDRREYFDVTAALRTLADSTVALMSSSALTQLPNGNWEIDSSVSFGDSYGLCASEPFREQTNPAFCSGFQVGSDLIATAGHCVTGNRDCRRTRFVFGFRVDAPGAVRTEVGPDDVYSCASIVGRVQRRGDDWAVLRVDRPIAGHAPLAIRRSGSVAVGTALVVIGHPAGLPVKIDAGGTVRDNSAQFHFEANLDTYGGNSGSAVFNAATQQVEGILVRGNADFVLNGSCYVSNVCPDAGCPGWEDATRATNFDHLVP